MKSLIYKAKKKSFDKKKITSSMKIGLYDGKITLYQPQCPMITPNIVKTRIDWINRKSRTSGFAGADKIVQFRLSEKRVKIRWFSNISGFT